MFSYVPKSLDSIKFVESGSGFDELTESLNEGKVQFVYWRVPIKNTHKFVYITWCGEGVTGMMKGNSANHFIEFRNFLNVCITSYY